MDFVEAGVERVDQRDVQSVLPDHRFVGVLVAVLVPGVVRRDREVARADGEFLAVHDRPGAGALVHEAQRGGLVAVRGHRLARAHDLQAGVQQADGRAEFAPAGVDQHHHPATGVVRPDQWQRLADQRCQVGVAPEHRDGLRLRVPGLDLVRHRPERARLLFGQLLVVGGEFGAVPDPGPAQPGVVVVVHASSRWVPGSGGSSGRCPSVNCTGRCGRLSTCSRKTSNRL